jgi:ribosomal protein S3
MKTVGTWSVDTDVKSWIDRKIANKSQFVNKILKDAMIHEILKDARKEHMPKCALCKSTLRYDHNDEPICVNIHCGGV